MDNSLFIAREEVAMHGNLRRLGRVSIERACDLRRGTREPLSRTAARGRLGQKGCRPLATEYLPSRGG